MMFFNSIKENLTMIDISNYVVHWNMKNLKQEKEGSIKRFWIISGDHHSMSGEKKKSELGRKMA